MRAVGDQSLVGVIGDLEDDVGVADRAEAGWRSFLEPLPVAVTSWRATSADVLTLAGLIGGEHPADEAVPGMTTVCRSVIDQLCA